MPFLLLLLLMVACLPVEWPAPPLGLGMHGALSLTWLGIGLVLAGALGLALWTQYGLQRPHLDRDIVLNRYVTGRFYHLLGLFVVYGLSLYVLGWGWVVQSVCSFGATPDDNQSPILPGTELLVLAPFLVGLVLSWACFYDAERALHETSRRGRSGTPFWGRWAYVAFHFRQNFALVFAPVALLILAEILLRLCPQLQNERWFVAVANCFFIVFLICMPWVLRLVLGLQPLPDSPLRDRLIATAKRLRFRFSNILLWNTRGGVANAMVAGLLPYPRYVLLTDRLITELTPDEIEAVFGHEIGHVKHRHMLYYLGFLMVSLMVVSALWQAVDVESALNLTARQDLAVLPRVALLGTYIFVVFGFLSRRCERQADIYGCRAVSCDRPDCAGHAGDRLPAPVSRTLCPTGISIFIDALEKVAVSNGISRDRPGWLQSWQHSTIARRVEFLQRIRHDPKVERRFQRTVALVKWALFLGLGGALAALGHWQGIDGLLPF